MSVPAIVLAAGASRRLGQPKQLVCLDGETLLDRTVRATREAGADPVCVVLGAHADEVQARVQTASLQVVMNAGWEQGIASSIHAGVRWVERNQPQAGGVLLLVCDQPGLTSRHLRELLRAFDEAAPGCVIASAYGGICGVPAVFPRSEFARLASLEGDEGARKLLKDRGRCVVEVAFNEGLMDIDTPEDLAKILPGFMGGER